MTGYLISFENGAMDFPEEDLPDVAKAARAVVQEAKDAGVFLFTGGLDYDVEPPSWPPMGRSPTARTRRARNSSAASSSSTYWCGLTSRSAPRRSPHGPR